FYTTSGIPELHSGLPCSAALGVPAALTLSFAPTMCPLQRPRPSPPADAGIRLLCSGPHDVGMYGRRRWRQILKMLFFLNIVPSAFVLCPACIFSVLS
ncbi:unnamed protein product, partial [Staurois parvus]